MLGIGKEIRFRLAAILLAHWSKFVALIKGAKDQMGHGAKGFLAPPLPL